MLLLIWCVVGLLLGRLIRRLSVALLLGSAIWAISMATIAASDGHGLPLDGDSVGVFTTLASALLGCLAGAFFRGRGTLDRESGNPR